MHIAFVLGTRPEIIKLASLIKACQDQGVRHTLIHTNQHYSASMDGRFFEELALPPAHYHLGAGSSATGVQVGRMVAGVVPLLTELQPDYLIVQGDTNSALAGGLAASKAGLPVAHVEAGLRSFDRSMPEENNRIQLDHLATYWFCPSELQVGLLAQEGLTGPRVHVTGNTGVDATLMYAPRALACSHILECFGLAPEGYLLLTCHRPSNTDDLAHFAELMAAVQCLAEARGQVVVFPCHPRLTPAHHAILVRLPLIRCCEPLGYLDMLALLQQTALLLTDSGGLQEEAYVLRRRCLVLRQNTERPETLETGGAQLLMERSPGALFEAAEALDRRSDVLWSNVLGDGQAYQRILAALLEPAY